jgi:hypothetical protein
MVALKRNVHMNMMSLAMLAQADREETNLEAFCASLFSPSPNISHALRQAVSERPGALARRCGILE